MLVDARKSYVFFRLLGFSRVAQCLGREGVMFDFPMSPRSRSYFTNRQDSQVDFLGAQLDLY
jgi:hypothetical protein